jgi:hypothetical protein
MMLVTLNNNCNHSIEITLKPQRVLIGENILWGFLLYQ